jgi:hypothetical protein
MSQARSREIFLNGALNYPNAAPNIFAAFQIKTASGLNNYYRTVKKVFRAVNASHNKSTMRSQQRKATSSSSGMTSQTSMNFPLARDIFTNHLSWPLGNMSPSAQGQGLREDERLPRLAA